MYVYIYIHTHKTFLQTNDKSRKPKTTKRPGRWLPTRGRSCASENREDLRQGFGFTVWGLMYELTMALGVAEGVLSLGL